MILNASTIEIDANALLIWVSIAALFLSLIGYVIKQAVDKSKTQMRVTTLESQNESLQQMVNSRFQEIDNKFEKHDDKWEVFKKEMFENMKTELKDHENRIIAQVTLLTKRS